MNSHVTIRTNILITTAVIVTVLLALLLSQQDGRDGSAFVAMLTGTEAAAAPTDEAATILLPTTTAAAMATGTAVRIDVKTAVSILPHCANAPAHWLPHTAHADETIYTLSIFSGATVAEIAQANCLAMAQNIAGLTIYLPPTVPTRIACGPPNWWYSQFVYAGDTLYGLAAQHGTTVYAIMQANCLSNGYLVAGRTLYLPPPVIIITAVPPIPPTFTPTIMPTIAPTTVPTSTPTLPTAVPTITPTLLPTTVPTSTMPATPTPLPPITPTMTFTPLPTVPTATVVATGTAVATPVNTAVPTATPLPPTVPPPTATTAP